MKKGNKGKKVSQKEKEKQENNNADTFYSKEEIELLDYFHDETNHKFEDEEVYDLMEKYKNDKELILQELNELLKQRKRGGDYDWQEVGKGN